MRSREGGWTLVEQLVVMLLMVVVLGAALSVLETAWRLEPADLEWSSTVAEAPTGIYKMTRELRQGTNVNLVSPYSFSADVTTFGTLYHVLYQCDLNSTCTRKSDPTTPPTPGPGGVPMVNNVQNPTLGVAVFTQPSPNYYQVVVKVSTAGPIKTGFSHTLTFTDGFFARNA